MDSELPDLYEKLEGVYTTFKLQTVTNPDPLVGGSIIPLYFSELGPSTSTNKELYLLYKEYELKFGTVI